MKPLPIRLSIFAALLCLASMAKAEIYSLPLFVTSTASDLSTGVVRILNGTDESGTVAIYAIDDIGTRSGPATFTLNGSAAVEFSASDLVAGNAAEGLIGGIGNVSGDVRLEIDTDLRIVPTAYVRAADGTLSAMHDTVRRRAASGGGYEFLVPVFNLSTQMTQASRLRLINPGDAAASVTIKGRDDYGTAGMDAVELTLAAGTTTTLTAQQLEAGDTDLTGSLGAGVGKWRLTVSSDRRLQVVNVVSSTSGYVNNLSTTALSGLAPVDHEAFNERFVDSGIEYRTDSGDLTFTAEAGDRFTETGEADGIAVSFTGSYKYEAIGQDLGLATLSYDIGRECEANLYFGFPTSGWLASFCTVADHPDGFWVAGNWSVVDGSADDSAVSYVVEAVLPGVPTSGFFAPSTLSDGGSVTLTGGGTTIMLTDSAYFELDDGTRYTCTSSDGCAITNGTVTQGTVIGTPAGGDEIDTFPTFRTATPPGNQSFTAGTPIDTLTLPEASSGNGTLTYNLSPDVPGLTFDATTRQLTGIPTTAGRSDMRYTVTDEDGDSDTMRFTIDVDSGIAAGDHFDLYAPDDNSTPRGITYANGRFYVVDGSAKVYAYSESGLREPSSDIELPPTPSADSHINSIEGIAYANGRFFVIEYGEYGISEIHSYGESGQREGIFSLDSANDSPSGIAFANGRFYVVNDGYIDVNPKVFAYSEDWQRDPAGDFDLDVENNEPVGISYANGRFYVVERGYHDDDPKVFAYAESGQRDATGDFELDVENDEPEGITYANDRFYVVDDGFWDDDAFAPLGEPKVFVYSEAGQRDAASDIDLPINDGNFGASGIAHANGRFYVVDVGKYDDAKVYVYTESGQRDAVAEFDLDNDSYTPTGIAYANGRLYVLGRGSVYAYFETGERDQTADFELGADPFSDYFDPVGLTYANGRFYVVLEDYNNREEAKVVAYSETGQRDPAADFDLDISYPTGVTNANGRFYVVSWWGGVVAYSETGQRDPLADFDLVAENDDPQGIIYANGQYYVVDGENEKVYFYAGAVEDENPEVDDTIITAWRVGDALPDVPTAGTFVPATLANGSVSSTGSGTTITLNEGGFFELNDGTRYMCSSADGCAIENGIVTRGVIEATLDDPAILTIVQQNPLPENPHYTIMQADGQIQYWVANDLEPAQALHIGPDGSRTRIYDDQDGAISTIVDEVTGDVIRILYPSETRTDVLVFDAAGTFLAGVAVYEEDGGYKIGNIGGRHEFDNVDIRGNQFRDDDEIGTFRLYTVANGDLDNEAAMPREFADLVDELEALVDAEVQDLSGFFLTRSSTLFVTGAVLPTPRSRIVRGIAAVAGVVIAAKTGSGLGFLLGGSERIASAAKDAVFAKLRGQDVTTAIADGVIDSLSVCNLVARAIVLNKMCEASVSYLAGEFEGDSIVDHVADIALKKISPIAPHALTDVKAVTEVVEYVDRQIEPGQEPEPDELLSVEELLPRLERPIAVRADVEIDKSKTPTGDVGERTEGDSLEFKLEGTLDANGHFEINGCLEDFSDCPDEERMSMSGQLERDELGDINFAEGGYSWGTPSAWPPHEGSQQSEPHDLGSIQVSAQGGGSWSWGGPSVRIDTPVGQESLSLYTFPVTGGTVDNPLYYETVYYGYGSGEQAIQECESRRLDDPFRDCDFNYPMSVHEPGHRCSVIAVIRHKLEIYGGPPRDTDREYAILVYAFADNRASAEQQVLDDAEEFTVEPYHSAQGPHVMFSMCVN